MRVTRSGVPRMAFESESTIVDEEGWLGRPDVAVLDDGNWLLVYRQAAAHGPSDDATIHARISDDEGASWTAADTGLDGDSIAGMPVSIDGENLYRPLLVESSNGELLLLVGRGSADGSAYSGTQLFRSTNGGSSWDDEGKISFTDSPYSDDSVLAAEDAAVHSETGDVYVSAYVDPENDRSAPYEAGLVRSTDDGATWEWVNRITDASAGNLNESGIACPSGATLVSVIRDGGNDATWLRRSPDLGRTWSDLVDISGYVGVINAPRLFVEGVVDDSMASNDGPLFLSGRLVAGGRSNALAVSDDEGASWSPVARGPSYSDGGYTSIVKRSDDTFYQVGYGGSKTDSNIVSTVFTRDPEAIGPTNRVTDFRTVGEWYQNASGDPIAVSITTEASGSAASSRPELHVSPRKDSVLTSTLVDRDAATAQGSSPVRPGVSGIVPNGHYYRCEVQGVGSILDWFEQRL